MRAVDVVQNDTIAITPTNLCFDSVPLYLRHAWTIWCPAGHAPRSLPRLVHAPTYLSCRQVLNFAVKLALRKPDDKQVQSLASFVLEMARFDLSHDLRDRARFMTAMLGLATADEGVNEAALLALNAKAGQVRAAAGWRHLSLLWYLDLF